MLKKWIRTFYSDNGILTDYSLTAQNDSTFPAVMVAAEDYIYVGQYFPFNNMYFKIGVANINASVMSVQYWGEKQWNDAVDVIDATSVGGKTLAQSGVIQWSPDEDLMWQATDDTSDVNNATPTELNSLTIYDLYWMRFKVSANLGATTTIDKIAYCFCDDMIVTNLDPDINDYLTNWKAAKTNWIDQILIASEHLVLDLKQGDIIKSGANILRFDEIYLACAYRTLAVIYNGLGEKFKDKREKALSEYKGIMQGMQLTIDVTGDALVNTGEISARSGRLVR